jgi:hypothetical protein
MLDMLEEVTFRSAKSDNVQLLGSVRTIINLRDDADVKAANQPGLIKSKDGILGVFKRVNAKEAKLTFTVTTNANKSLELTYPLINGVKVIDSKNRNTLRLQDIPSGTRIHVYLNEEPDGSLGVNIMEIAVTTD